MDPNDSGLYRRSIDRNFFRVLQVSGTNPSLVCNLIEYSIDESPEYYAVSYAWGVQEASQVISGNHKGFAVTPHLYEGIRSIATVHGCQNLWIDAICIDQNNSTEKAEQVSIMHRIYRQATGVYVWLGAAKDDSDAVMQFIADNEQALLELQFSSNFLEEAAGTAPKLDSVLSSLSPEMLWSTWTLLMRDWFQRVWVFQEIMLANQSDFVCGMRTVSGELIYRFIRECHRSNIRRRALEGDFVLEGSFEHAASMMLVWQLKHRKPDIVPYISDFISIVEVCRLKKAKEPVDHVYGLLSLCKSNTYIDGLEIDYSDFNRVNYWTLYTQLGKLVLTHEPQLHLFSIASSKYRPPGLPSWCPNFNVEPETPSRLHTYPAGWPNASHFEWSKSREDSLSCLENHSGFRQESDVSTNSACQSIVVQGTIVDHILKTTKYYDLSVDFSIFAEQNITRLMDFVSAFLDWSSEIIEMASENYGTQYQDGVPEELWRTVIGDVERTSAGSSWPAASERQVGLKIYMDYMKALQRELRRIQEGSPLTGEAVKLLASNQDEFDKFGSSFGHIWPGRIFFKTSEGRIGFASRHVREGDLICMFYSGTSMYVLRESPARSPIPATSTPTYEFVSTAYTHGLMNGEAFELMDEGKAVEQEFVII